MFARFTLLIEIEIDNFRIILQTGNQSFFSYDKIKKQLAWQHQIYWRQYL